MVKRPFLFVLICLACFHCIYSTNKSKSRRKLTESPEEVYHQLKESQASINNSTEAFCFHGPSGTKNSFIKNEYSKYVKNHNVLVYPFCLMVRELGNRLGNYFHEIACAEASGLHFITVHPQWDITGAVTSNSTKVATESSRLAFLQALPDVIIHPHAVDKITARNKLNHECKCNRYCWQHLHAPWVNRTSSIRHYMKNALQAYYNVILPQNPTTSIDPDVDITNAKETSSLPLIPDVAIQYRCGDNIAFSYLYGILPFTAFDQILANYTKDNQIRYLYVLSDHPSRASHSPYTSRCKLILEKLLEYLSEKLPPTTTIVIKRGGDLFLDMIRLSRAKLMICSASTYCFWPALATDGQAYFPVTSLIAGADTIELAPDFGPRFHWINDPKIISNFKGIRPWTGIIDILMGKKAPPS